MLVFSRIWCTKCLFEGVQRIFPRDVGLSIEGKGSAIHFLHVLLRIAKDGSTRIAPFSDNREFSRGRAEFQQKARLGNFLGKEVQPQRILRQFVWAKLIAYNAVCEGVPDALMSPSADLLAEISLLNWPVHWLGKALASVPARHRSPYFSIMRRLSKHFKFHSDDRTVIELEDLYKLVAHDLGLDCEKCC